MENSNGAEKDVEARWEEWNKDPDNDNKAELFVRAAIRAKWPFYGTSETNQGSTGWRKWLGIEKLPWEK